MEKIFNTAGLNPPVISKTKHVMKAVVTEGVGGIEKLNYSEVPVPILQADEVLLQVLASSVNATDINTRLGWYEPTVTASVSTLAGQAVQTQVQGTGWNQSTHFPFIQGTDCCGRVVAVFNQVHSFLIEKRVLVRPCMRVQGFDSLDSVWLGSDFDGAFAEYVKVPASEVFPVDCDWSDAELGTIPCAYGTAENMLEQAGLTKGQHLVVTGASGGVGVAAVQLAKRRGAVVTAVTSASKMNALRALGADTVIDRNVPVLESVGLRSVDMVLDNVAGDHFSQWLQVLRRGGKYVTSGAIAGPMVTLDLRTLYLNNLTIIGCTAWAATVFPNLTAYIEHGEFSPVVAKVFPMDHIAQAQEEFLTKAHVGKIALIPKP